MNIVLCGMPGSGKTTVSGELARLYGMTAVDTDALIVEKYGEINAIFENFGEPYFRDIEEEVCAYAAAKYDNAVISVGGGCVLRQANVNNLKASGKIVYLCASPETLIKRLEGDTTRPLLKGGVEERVHTLYSKRARIYREVADVILDVDNLTPTEAAEKIKGLIK